MFPLLALALALPSIAAGAPAPVDARPAVVPGRYLVQIHSGSDAAAVSLHHEAVRRLARRGAADEPIQRAFRIGGLNAYLASFDARAVAEVGALEDVVAVVPDEYVYVERTAPVVMGERDVVVQEDSIWSLGDLSHVAPGAGEYVYDGSAGEGMTAYVFDTGIRLSHVEFEGRARFGVNGLTNSTDASGASKDDDGHGTHCAATVVGKTFGVAKRAQVVDVKVFDGGAGPMSAILTGMQWAVNDVVQRGAQSTSVFSLSLGAQTTSTILDDAIKAAYDMGILSVVAAGNEDAPIESSSPARAPEAFTVGMTQPDRARVSLITNVFGSNYGPEMDVFAPGRDIVSASHLSDTGNSTKTGTSMATPLVAGLVCYLRAKEGGLGTPKEVTDRILELALRDVVTDPKGSPNLLVNNGSGA